MEMLTARGLILSYSTTIAAQVLTGSAPNQYYVPGDPGDGAFTTIGCIKDVPNFDNIAVEMSEHRCLDDTEKFVAKFPTGFMTSEDTTIKVAFAKALYSTLKALAIAGTELTLKLTYAKLPSETNASKSLRTGYITNITDMVPGDGKEVDANISIAWSRASLFTSGA